LESFTYSKITKQLLKRELNNEAFFTLLRYIYFLLVTDADTTRNIYIHKCLQL